MLPARNLDPLQVDVEIRDRASADDCHGAAARRMQMFDELQESGIDLDSVRSIGNVEEGTVEIEEIRPSRGSSKDAPAHRHGFSLCVPLARGARPPRRAALDAAWQRHRGASCPPSERR